MPVTVLDIDTQRLKRFCSGTGAACRSLHVVGQLYKAAAQRVGTDIDQFACIFKLLQLIGGQASL